MNKKKLCLLLCGILFFLNTGISLEQSIEYKDNQYLGKIEKESYGQLTSKDYNTIMDSGDVEFRFKLVDMFKDWYNNVKHITGERTR